MIELRGATPSTGRPPSVPRAKVTPPPPVGLARQRLLGALGKARSARLVLVTAPPGAGKTTLLAGYAEQCRSGPDCAVAWCRIEVQDASPAGLTRILGTAVTIALEGTGREVASDDLLLALLDAPGPRLVIVIDDAHLLTDTAAEATLARIVRLLPQRVQVLLASRSEPGFVSCGPRLSGMVADITADDLRFRSWEVEALFRECYRTPLPPEDAAALTRHTEGWAAGLQLFHLATSEKPEAERSTAVASLWGKSRLLRRYLASHVLAALPHDVADFLVRSCALGVLEGSLCDRLLDRIDSHLVLRDLADANLFTLRCDDEGFYYRYHAVLQCQLESMLAERLGADRTRTWYRRAAALLDEAGLWPAAYRAYARAEDWGAGAQVLQRCGVQSVADPPTILLPRLLDDDPWLLLAAARRHAAAGRLGEAIEAFGTSEHRFDDPDLRRRCRAERRLLAPWVPGSPPAPVSSWSDALRGAVSSGPGPLGRAEPRSTDPGWQLATGLAALLDARPAAALRALRQAAAAPAAQAPGVVPLAARIATAVVHQHCDAGLEDPGEWDGEVLALEAELAGYPWLARVARAVAAAGEPATLHALAADCDADGDSWGALVVALLAAVGLRRRGAEAAAELAALERRADRLGAAAVLSWARSVRPAGVPAAAPQRRVVLRCFGRFSLTVDGRDVELSALRPRARAALRLLALHAGLPVHEEVLLDALWPGVSPAAGKRNLQVTVSSVRAVLEPGRPRGTPGMLRRRGEAYVLDLPPDTDSDIHTFTRALARWRAAGNPSDAAAALREALSAYEGELLPEDGPAEWVVAERDRLRGQAAEASVALAELALDGGDAAAAMQACHAALRSDRFHDAAWRLLIEACERAGHAAAAQRARRRYQAALAELGCVL